MTDAPDADGRADPNAPTERRGVVVAFPGARTAAARTPETPFAPDEAWRKRIVRDERERIARILSHPVAVGLERLAFHLAVFTDTSVDEAVPVLKAASENAECFSQDMANVTADEFAKYFPTLN